MNATRTTVTEALWRCGRGIARALLVMNALAGMTLGTVAHAQIAFRGASQATQPVPTFRAFNQATAVVTPPAPTFVNPLSAIAAAASGGADPTVTLPAHALDDILLLATIVRSNTATVATPAGWTQIGTPTVRAAVATYQFFWTRAGPTTVPNPVIDRTGTTGDVYAAVIVYRGAYAVGDPWQVKGPVVTGITDPSVITGITTLTANSLVVVPVAGEDNNNASIITTGTDPAAYTEHYVQSGTGADGVITFSEFVRTTAGATGNVSVNWNVAVPIGFGGIVLALRPVTAALTITKPALTAQNDVMIASIGFRANQPGLSTDIVITPPAGWALVGPNGRQDNPGPTDNGLAVYLKVAGAAEPANYRWGLTCTATCATNGFNAAQGGILSFFNVDTATPINVENGVPTVAGAQTTPSVTTSAANTMLVASHTIANAGTWVATPGGPLGPMNERVDVTSGALSTEINQLLQAAAGLVGQYQATPAVDDDAGNAHILALRPAQQSTITIPRPTVPAATAANDVMIATIGFRPATLPTPMPVGWNFVRRIDTTDGSLGGAPSSLAVYWKVAGDAASDPGPYTWDFLSPGYLAGGILSFSGVDITGPTPIDVENGNCTPQPFPCPNLTLAHATPDLVTTMANTMLVTSHTYASAGTWTPPPAIGGDAAMNEAVDVQHGIQSLSAHYVLHAAAGATGAKTATASRDPDPGNAHILALKPIATVVTPGGFNAYEVGTAGITGVIMTKVSGTAFNLDVIALDPAKTAILASFTGTVRVEVVDASSGGAPDANGCVDPGWPVVYTATPNPTFVSGDNGRKTVSFTVPNSYRNARVRIVSPDTATYAAATAKGCSNNNFAIRPSIFSAPTSTFNNSGTAGAPMTTAGGNFDITAVAIAGYNGTPTIDNTKITAHAGAVQNGSVSGSFGAANPATGSANGSTFTYSEVGNFTIGVNGVYDSTFTAVDPPGTECTNDFSNALVGGLYGCSFGNSVASAAIGRFRPDHFIVTPGTLTNRQALSCASTFSYEGEQLRVTFMLTARNGLGSPATTQNYTTASGFARLDGTVYTNFGFGAVDVADLTPPLSDTALTARVPSGTSSGTWLSGIGSFTVDLAVSRAASPDGPFESFRLGVLPVDADGVTLRAADLDLDTTVPANGNDRVLLGSSRIRFGRLAMRNANGSQLVPLSVPLETQYWNGTVFITNTDDNCTSIVAANVGLGNYTGNLNSPETTPTVSGAFSAGRKNIVMSAPGAANNGSVDIVVNLGTTTTIDSCLTWGTTPTPTGANLSYLRGLWCGATYTKDPTARATFGVFKGAEEVIFIRENF